MNGISWVICPGLHDPVLTDDFTAIAQAQIPALHTVQQLVPDPSQLGRPILAADPKTSPAVGVIAFSAGVVAAVALLQRWQWSGGQVAGLIALDGWGVPLPTHYRTFRLSHDRFTHRSSGLLGSGSVNFYADPAVPHLQLWQAPQTVSGWQLDTTSGYAVQATTAIDFLALAVDTLTEHANSKKAS